MEEKLMGFAMKKILCIGLCVLLFAGCGGYATVSSERFESMDTFMQLELYGSEATTVAVKEEILRLDGLFSATNADSDVYRLNRDGSARIDAATREVLGKTQEYSVLLDNDLDIFVYPLVEAWGFISRDYTIPDSAAIAALLPAAQTAAVTLSADNQAQITEQGAKLDLGAVAKGYAADRAVDMMRAQGVSSGILNLGGTVAAVGKKPTGEPWRVGISDPDNSAAYFGSVLCSDRFVATSGNYERYFERDGRRYCHIINPRTGYPVDNGTVSVTIISDNGFKSDALSTALFVKGADGAQAFWQEHPDFDYILLDDSGDLYITEGIADSFRLLSGYDYTVHTIKSGRA